VELTAEKGENVFPLEFIILLPGCAIVYAAYRLKLVNFQQFTYMALGVLLVSLLVPNLIDIRELGWAVFDVIVVALLAIMVYVLTREKRNRPKT
jgi:hypothetical membrane protein